jgi:hypothetical protein
LETEDAKKMSTSESTTKESETKEELMARLEREGIEKMKKLNAEIPHCGGIPLLSDKDIDKVTDFMKEGEKEFVKKTGRHMTYAEMRSLYG